MSKFSEELTCLMNTRNFPLDEVTRDIGISRASFFKYKSGSRRPAEISVVEKIAEVLRLNYDEKQRLTEAYLIDQIGEYKYRGMLAVEKLLTISVGSLYARRKDSEAPKLVQKTGARTILSGSVSVTMHILALISEGIRQGNVTVFETISSDEIFSYIRQVKARHPENEILHIMAMNGSDNAYVQDRLYNVERLGSIFMTLCSCEGYRPFHYYSSLSTLRTLGILQTNMILTKDCVMCYAEDFSSAVICRDDESVDMYSNIAAGIRRIASPFAEKMNLADSIKTYGMFNESSEVRYSFIPGLCITSVIEKTDDLLEKNVRHDLEGIDEFLIGYEKYTANLQASLAVNNGKHHCVVSGPALHFNYANGLLNEFPKEATIPLDKNGTAKLLRRFRRVSAKYDFRVLDDDRLPAENTIGLEVIPGLAMISVILPGELAMRVILIREQGTAAMIYDYLSSVYEGKALGGAEREKWYEKLLSE